MNDRHIFTYGSDHHEVRNAYVLITGCDSEQARGIMVALHGAAWAFQYDADDARTTAMMERHDMQLVETVAVMADRVFVMDPR